MNARNRNILLGVLCTLVIGGAIWLIVWLVNRPENVDIVSAGSDSTTSPSLVKFAQTESGLIARIDETKFVVNDTVAAHWLSVVGDLAPGDDVVLHLTETDNFTAFSSLGSVVSVDFDESTEFPHMLPGDFQPDSVQGFVVTDGSTDSATGELIITESAAFGGTGGSTGGTGGDEDAGSSGCEETTLPVLSATMSGRRSYTVGGTISIEYREDLVDGQVVQKPVLRFDNVQVPNAPDPYLYLSKRPVGSDTWDGDEDIFIPIEGTDEGFFNKAGSFTQDIDQIITDVSTLQEYTDGSFIVWCRRFSVFMGAGQLEVTSDVTVSACDAQNNTDVVDTDAGMGDDTPATPPASAPAPAPQDAPPALAAQMTGHRSYSVGGTIAIGYRQDLVDGQVVQIPVLTLTNTVVPNAPDAFLYLSKRPAEPQTWDGDVDVMILIDGVNGGFFAKTGTFSQDLDEVPVDQIEDYAGGTFIVWCRQFNVYMGSGQIEVV